MPVSSDNFGVIGFVFPTPIGCDYPAESDVRYGIVYDFGDMIGTLLVPSMPSVDTILLHSPADILRTALINLGIGLTPSSTPWPIYASSEPDIPDNCITVYDTIGMDDGRTMPDGHLQQHQGVQIRIRSVDHMIGWQKSHLIRSTIAEGIYDLPVTIGVSSYILHSVNNISNILALGKEIPTSKRSVFTINAIVSVKHVV